MGRGLEQACARLKLFVARAPDVPKESGEGSGILCAVVWYLLQKSNIHVLPPTPSLERMRIKEYSNQAI